VAPWPPARRTLCQSLSVIPQAGHAPST
jgi:hypothetical protein